MSILGALYRANKRSVHRLSIRGSQRSLPPEAGKGYAGYAACQSAVHETSDPQETIYTMLYYLILYYTILYYTILYYTILYYTLLYSTILCYTLLCYTILASTLEGRGGSQHMLAFSLYNSTRICIQNVCIFTCEPYIYICMYTYMYINMCIYL